MRVRALGIGSTVVAILSLVAVRSADAQCGSVGGAFVNFESGHVRPVALSPDGTKLFAVNTPDNRLAIYNVTAGAPGLTLAAEVPVGLEPVAVAARSNTEVWVVNHLSDSVSIVDVSGTPRVVRTLLVGDEPRDIVFAGSAGNRAFISCARRGQNRFPTNPATGPQLTTEGVGRADVWVFDANALGAALGGTPLGQVQLFSDTPRALAASLDGNTVFAAGFKTGNRTTTVNQLTVDGNSNGLTRPPFPGGFTPNPPDTGIIVGQDAGGAWRDGVSAPPQDWTPVIPFSLPDTDVFLINANTLPTSIIPPSANTVVGVGTILFNMAVRPTNGKLYVSNLEAQNRTRFEPTINGHIAESRITVVTGTTPVAQHLNSHINYAVTPGPQSERDQSLAFPLAMVFSADGNTLFVPGFGSAKVGAYDANQVEAGTPGVNKQLIAVGQGPSGVALDQTNNRLYVMNRIDHTISVVSNASVNGPSRAQTAVVALRFDPSPPSTKDGRRFLYDANISGHGDSACASCHIFGDMDDLGWDLGDPFGTVESNFNPFRLVLGTPIFHPLKGPMTTQTLRGMADAGPMHWRGDRSGAAFLNDPNALNEDLAFKKFNPAFVGLLGNATQLSTADMQAYTNFILSVRLPPNPIRALNDVGTAAQISGADLFDGPTLTDGVQTCEGCHRLPLGTDGFSTFEGESQEFKIAHMRNLYQKVGMFGFPSGVSGLPGTGFLGDQVRGFGFLHDGSVATVNIFLSAQVFNLNATQQLNLEQFSLAFDTGLKPSVGQQVSATPTTFSDANVITRIADLIARDDSGHCELTVKGNVGGLARGWVYVGSNNFQPDRNADSVITSTALRTLAGTTGQEQTYTCVPPGSGTRIGVDRDLDGFFDRTELDAGTDPASNCSFPGSGTTTTTTSTTSTSTTTAGATTTTTLPGAFVLVPTRSLTLRDDNAVPIDTFKRRISFKSDTKLEAPANKVVFPTPLSGGDPRVGGATLRVYNSNPAVGSPTDDVTVNLPAAQWIVLGSSVVTGYRYDNPDPNGPIKRVTVKNDLIQVKGGKPNWSYTLNESSQGRIAVRLQLGNATPWCADAPAKVGGTPPTTVNNDKVDKFTAQPKTAAPGTCPAP